MRHSTIKLFLFLSFIVYTSCSSNEKGEKEKANTHMHKSNFKELVNRFEDTERDVWQKPNLILEKLGDLQGKKVADIGAGTGYLSFKLREKGAEVVAKDIDERFIKYIDSVSTSLPDSLKINAAIIPLDNPQLEDLSFDLVTLLNTYHHIENRVSYFFKVWKGLKDGGKLVIIDFKKKESSHGPPIEMRLNEMEVSKELKKAGFAKVIIDMTTLEEQYIITAKKVLKKENLMEQSKKYDK
jgi:2-polyprenyl-3-methyl-5-hydroxy-6-metoxy-1,4-benzoquinol methylase